MNDLEGLRQWLPLRPDDKFFGLERDPKIIVGNITVRPDSSVSDFEARSWKERLFGRPWSPLVKNKPCQRVYILEDNTAYCSWKTFERLKSEIT